MVLRTHVNKKIIHDTTRSFTNGFLAIAKSHFYAQTSNASITGLSFLYPSIRRSLSCHSLLRCSTSTLAKKVGGLHKRAAHTLAQSQQDDATDPSNEAVALDGDADIESNASSSRLSDDTGSSAEKTKLQPHPAIKDHAPMNSTISSNRINVENLINLKRQRTAQEKQLMWRAWTGMSDDIQATRLQLLESLLDMLQTEDVQDAYKMRALLDAKHSLIDATQRNFYTFWAHMILQEPDLAMTHFSKLSVDLRRQYWELFMAKIVETGDWNTGVNLWYDMRLDVDWRGRRGIRDLLYLIPNLHTWQFLSVLPQAAADDMKKLITSAVIIHLAESDRFQESSTVVEGAINNAAPLSDVAISIQMRALCRNGQQLSALDLYYLVVQGECKPAAPNRMHLEAINAAASMPDIRHLRTLLNTGLLATLHEAPGIRLNEAYTTAMAAFARHGQSLEVDNLFSAFKSLGHKPDVVMLSAVVHSRVQRLEITKAGEIFLSCEADYGIKPDQIVHNVLLHGFADTLNSQAALDLIVKMIEAGHHPDAYTTSTLIDLFARTRDAESAETAFDKMVELGVKPNVEVYGALMHAYIAAQDLDRARATFAAFRDSGLRPNAYIMNILLKQCVLEGRGTADMLEVVASMKAIGIEPNNATHTQIMRARIKESNLKGALQVFQSLKSPNEYHYTVLMVGLIREGTAEGLDALLYYYNEMIDRGLKPSFVTLAVLMNVFTLQRSPDFTHRANKLLENLASWSEVDLSSKFSPRIVPSPNIYLPLFRRRKGPRGVDLLHTEKVFKMFLKSIANTDGRPNVSMLTAVMSVYADARQTNKVRSLFIAIKKETDRLYRYNIVPALNLSRDVKGQAQQASDFESPSTSDDINTRTTTQVSLGARFVLAAPLTVFTKHMVSVKRFAEVERVWSGLAQQGYDFDVANWNLYVQIQIKQGKIERACDLLSEKFLAGGQRIYKRTKYEMLHAFDVLKNGQERSEENAQVGISAAADEQEGSKVWSRIVDAHRDVVEALEA